jgi:hypothetical protein
MFDEARSSCSIEVAETGDAKKMRVAMFTDADSNKFEDPQKAIKVKHETDGWFEVDLRDFMWDRVTAH